MRPPLWRHRAAAVNEQRAEHCRAERHGLCASMCAFQCAADWHTHIYKPAPACAIGNVLLLLWRPPPGCGGLRAAGKLQASCACAKAALSPPRLLRRAPPSQLKRALRPKTLTSRSPAELDALKQSRQQPAEGHLRHRIGGPPSPARPAEFRPVSSELRRRVAGCSKQPKATNAAARRRVRTLPRCCYVRAPAHRSLGDHCCVESIALLHPKRAHLASQRASQRHQPKPQQQRLELELKFELELASWTD